LSPAPQAAKKPAMLRLRHDTPRAWFDAVNEDLTAFLQDHAANERKVSQSALVLATHYPGHFELVEAALEIAEEELAHFRQIWEVLKARGATLGYDAPDPYMKGMFAPIRKRHMDEYLLDRLIVYAVVEARGCERFGLVAEGLGAEDPLGRMYRGLEGSEARHHAHYLRLARLYFPADTVAARLDAVLDLEAEVVSRLPFRAALH
jgi:tRNA-(ms[2]io[6]A)-hydroxylase